MAYKIYFNTYQELNTFIEYAQDLWSWGCSVFRLSTKAGATMNMDTSDYSSSNSSGYVSFATLKPYIQQYYTNNGESPITLDIKLICPEGFRAEMDQNSYYESFSINFYSNAQTNYINLSYSENGINLVTAPYATFVGYIQQLYDKWKMYYKNNYED